MKKLIFLFSIAFITSFGFLQAQNIMQPTQDVVADDLDTPIELIDPKSKNDIELKYIKGQVGTYLGNTGLSGSFYCSGCISFTSEQMENYVGGTLSSIKIYIPSASRLPNLNVNFSRVWIKGALDGSVIYEQTFIPTLDSWNTITLTTPHAITEGAFAFGYTLLVEQLAAQEVRPWAMSRNTDDAYQPGGVNYIRNDNPNNYKEGAKWSSYTTAGNLAIIGVISGITLPEIDLAAVSVNLVNDTLFRVVNQEFNYSVKVANNGTKAQKDFQVQIIDDYDNVLAETLIAEFIEPETVISINFPYAAPMANHYISMRAKVIKEGDETPSNNISIPTSVLIFPTQPTTYGGHHITSAYGWAPGTSGRIIQGAIGYPATEDLVGKIITGVAYGFRDVSVVDGYIQTWIKNSLDDELNSVWLSEIDAVNGWQLIPVVPPYTIGFEDLYFGYIQDMNGYNITYSGGFPHFEGWWFKNGSNDWDNRNDPSTPSPHLVGNLTIAAMIVDKVAECEPVTDLKLEYNEDCEAILSWESPSAGSVFNVYRDATIRVASNITTTTIIDKGFSKDVEHKWYVTVVCEDGESTPVAVQKPVCQGNSVNDILTTTFKIYPNPSQGFITIKAESNFNKVEIVNFLGQTVIAQPNSDSMLTLNVSSLNAGIYFVRITTDNGISIQKFVKQ